MVVAITCRATRIKISFWSLFSGMLMLSIVLALLIRSFRRKLALL
jgi:hypothetical protein